MKILGVIPARYASTRFLGKPLADICGKPMIWWVYQQVLKSKIKHIVVATDHSCIMDICIKYGIPAIMTPTCHTAIERMYFVSLEIKADYLIQINGDEPILDSNSLDRMYDFIQTNQRKNFAAHLISKIKNIAEVLDPTNIKVIFHQKTHQTIYMSRTAIPTPYSSNLIDYYKHIGVLAYDQLSLSFFAHALPSHYEKIEGLETLRFIENRRNFFSVPFEGRPSLSVDTKKDLEEVIKLIQSNILDKKIL